MSVSMLPEGVVRRQVGVGQSAVIPRQQRPRIRLCVLVDGVAERVRECPEASATDVFEPGLAPCRGKRKPASYRITAHPKRTPP